MFATRNTKLKRLRSKVRSVIAANQVCESYSKLKAFMSGTSEGVLTLKLLRKQSLE